MPRTAPGWCGAKSGQPSARSPDQVVQAFPAGHNGQNSAESRYNSAGHALRSFGGGHTPRAFDQHSSRAIRSRAGRQNQSGWSRAAAETISGTLRAARAGPPPFSAINS